MERSIVPKFGSFKPEKSAHPKQEITVEDYVKPDSTSHSSRHGQRIRQSTHRDLKIVKDLSRHAEAANLHRHVSRNASAEPNIKTPEPPVLSCNKPSDTFFVDRRGDEGNVKYGSVNSYDVPAYRIAEAAITLGEPEHFRSGQDTFTSLLSRPGQVERALLRQQPKLIKSQVDGWVADDDFVSLEPLKRRRVSSDDENRSDRFSVRLGQPLGMDRFSIDSSTPENLSDEVEEVEIHASDVLDSKNLRKRHEWLSNRTKDGGNQAWLDFIDFQDIWLRNGQDSHVIAKIKLSMYEKASNDQSKPNDENREPLLLGMMEEATKVWSHKQLLSKWKSLLSGEGRKFNSLWMAYLDFSQTKLEAFNFENCREIFKEYFDFLKKFNSISDSTKQEPQPDLASQQKLHVFLRFSSFIRDAGYIELATALWQALLEFNFMSPEKDGQKLDNRVLLKSFEEFWDSEVPRIGETGSAGWCNVKNAKPPELAVSECDKLAQEDDAGHGHDFFQWAARERHEEAQNHTAGRTIEETAVDDPYHIVLFSDIEEFLFQLPVTSKYALIDAFLNFFGLPLLSTSSSNTNAWNGDPFLTSNHSYGSNMNDDSNLQLLGSLRNFQTSTESLFCMDNGPLASFCFENENRRSLRHPSARQFVSNVLYSLIAVMTSDDDLTEYCLAFELSNSQVQAKKKAKALLKTRQTRLRLYNAYALLEARASNNEASNRVFSMALSMASSLMPYEREDTIVLWHCWTLQALINDSTTVALDRILQIGTKGSTIRSTARISEPNAEEIATAKATLIEGHATSATAKNHRHAVLYVDLLALLAYFTTNLDLSTALNMYQSFSAVYNSMSHKSQDVSIFNRHLELLHQAQARLIALHTGLLSLPATPRPRRLYSPAGIRAALADSISLFPNNTIFLTLYAANEARFRIDDRVRDIMRTNLLKPASGEPHSRKREPSAASWAFAVRAEMARGVGLGSTTHSIRAAFERAVENRSGRSCAVLWAAYVAFEVEQLAGMRGVDGSVDAAKKKARDVFFRGLRCLPWVKAYAMLAFGRLEGVLKEEEKRQVYDLVVEKGLRIHVEYDEWANNGRKK